MHKSIPVFRKSPLFASLMNVFYLFPVCNNYRVSISDKWKKKFLEVSVGTFPREVVLRYQMVTIVLKVIPLKKKEYLKLSKTWSSS